MTRKELYENKLQMDYFSYNYIRFEEDFHPTNHGDESEKLLCFKQGKCQGWAGASFLF